MKLQKVVVVLGISVCLIATQMQATFGIGETGQGEDSELTREEELEEVDTKKIEQPVIAEEPAVPEQPVITEEPTGTEQSVIADEPQQPFGNVQIALLCAFKHGVIFFFVAFIFANIP